MLGLQMASGTGQEVAGTSRGWLPIWSLWNKGCKWAESRTLAAIWEHDTRAFLEQNTWSFGSPAPGHLGAQHSVNCLLALSCSFRLQVVSRLALHDCLCLLLIYTTTQNLPRPDVSQVQNLLNKVLLEQSHTTRLCLICRPLFTVTAKPASHRTREAI